MNLLHKILIWTPIAGAIYTGFFSVTQQADAELLANKVWPWIIYQFASAAIFATFVLDNLY